MQTFSAPIAGPALADTSSKRPVPKLRYRTFGLPVGDMQLPAGDLSVNVTVRQEEIFPSVIVKIKEPHAESQDTFG